MLDELPPDPLGSKRHLIITIERVVDANGVEGWPITYDSKGISPYEARSLLEQALSDFEAVLLDDDIEVDDD